MIFMERRPKSTQAPLAVIPATEASALLEKPRHADQRLVCRAIGYLGLLTLLFIQPLTRLMIHAIGTELHSHIVLVPLIFAYLLYLRRGQLPTRARRSNGGAMLLTVTGLAALLAGFAFRASLSLNDDLGLMALSYVCMVAAGGFFFFGTRWMAAAAFPFVFLIFMVPLPDGAVNWLETASKLASADATDWFFNLTGTPVLRDRTVFQLPGMVIEVAQECSGIRSSWVLFITSLLASHLFLKSPWRQALLVAFVIPLGILRNGFRILVIGLLCVHVGPHMIDSPIHHRGGPFFFALSLIPFFAFLWWLRRGDAGEKGAVAAADDEVR